METLIELLPIGMLLALSILLFSGLPIGFILAGVGLGFANGVCLYLLNRSKDKEAHMQASMIFTSNDMIIINLGVIAAGLLVMWLNSSLSDLMIGTGVFVIVLRGAMRILALAK